MVEPKQHEPPEQIEAHLATCLGLARRFCLHSDERYQEGGLRLLRELYRARRNGRMTLEQCKKYEGLLKVVRPHVRAMRDRGLRIPAVVGSELERVHAKGKRPTA
ncbi:MAG TPA: hypothetical protein VF590_27125 [Isosphaeraceae bacterium]|jgi:hypothetical protein